MSSDSNNPQETPTQPTLLKLSDDAIGMVRELLQYSLLLNINIVDSLRGLRLEVNPVTGNLIPSPAYVEAYNQMIQDLDARVDEVMKREEELEALATSEVVSSSDKDQVN